MKQWAVVDKERQLVETQDRHNVWVNATCETRKTARRIAKACRKEGIKCKVARVRIGVCA